MLARLDAGDLDSDAALRAVVADLRDHDVVDEARAMARRCADEAAAELEALPAGEVRDALAAFATMLVDRMA